MTVLPRSVLALIVSGAAACSGSELSSRDEAPGSQASEVANRSIQVATWNRALAADPASAIALGQLAALHLQIARETGEEGGYERAADYARRSISLRTSRNGSSFATLGAALVARHDFAAADSVVTALVELEPDIPEYRAMLGEIKLERGDYDAARIEFDSLHRVRNHLSIAPRLARWMELTGRDAQARRLSYDALASAKQRTGIPHEQLAWFYLRAGDIDMRHGRLRGARAAFDEGLRSAPADYRLLSALSRLEAVSGNSRKAIDYGERALAIRADPATLGLLGESHEALGDSAAAEQYFRAMEVAVAGQGEIRHRASSLVLLDRNLRVSEVMKSARSDIVTRRDVHGYDLLAWALHKSGRNREARAAMVSALSLGTQDAAFFYHAGMIEKALGDEPRAQFYLERALSINPRFHPTRPRAIRALLDSMRS